MQLVRPEYTVYTRHLLIDRIRYMFWKPRIYKQRTGINSYKWMIVWPKITYKHVAEL